MIPVSNWEPNSSTFFILKENVLFKFKNLNFNIGHWKASIFFIQNESLNFDILKEKRLLKNIEKSYNYRNVITTRV